MICLFDNVECFPFSDTSRHNDPTPSIIFYSPLFVSFFVHTSRLRLTLLCLSVAQAWSKRSFPFIALRLLI